MIYVFCTEQTIIAANRWPPRQMTSGGLLQPRRGPRTASMPQDSILAIVLYCNRLGAHPNPVQQSHASMRQDHYLIGVVPYFDATCYEAC